jgi:hypothetical protein
MKRQVIALIGTALVLSGCAVPVWQGSNGLAGLPRKTEVRVCDTFGNCWHKMLTPVLP